MALVFISYSSKDRQTAIEIFDVLKENGFDYIFLDHDKKSGIKSGEDWEKRLYDEIKRAHAMILLISPAWIESKWCFVEYTQARSLGKEIIPVIIDHGSNDEVDKWIKSNIQKTDYTQDKDALNRVISRIKEVSLETQQGFEWDTKKSPYPGLKTFEASEAAVYFGRERETVEIKERLNAMSYRNSPKILAIISSSGMGKSSLLKAGIIARLDKFDKERWIVIDTMRPKRRPLFEFAKAVSVSLNQSQNYKEIYQQLQEESYQDLLDEILAQLSMKQTNASILLPIDQAEEFFSIADKKEKERMFLILHYLLEQESFFTLWTLRADFLKYFQIDSAAKALHPYFEDYLLSPLASEKLTTVISKPAEVAGVRIEEELVEKLRGDVQNSESLPLLAHTLYKLYQKYHQNGTITLEDYLRFSNSETEPMETILQESAEESIKKFRKDLKVMEALKRAFIPNMVRIDEMNGEYVKRVAEWEDLPKNAHEVIEALVNDRLLIKKYDEKSDTTTVEIVHEALLRGWKLLRGWIEEEREFLSIKSRVEIAMYDWEQSAKSDDALLHGIALHNASSYLDRFKGDELTFISESIKREEQIKQEQEKLRKAKEQLQRRLLIGSIGFGAVSLGLGGFAFLKKEEADKQKSLALDSEKKAQLELENAKHNIGLALAQKAQNYYDNGRVLVNANLYAYNALQLINPKLDRSGGIDTGKNIIYNSDNCFYNKKTLTGHTSSVYSVAFSPDGKSIVSGSFDKTIKLWNAQSGKLLQTLKGHSNSVHSVAFSPDGKSIVSSSSDKTIKLWNIAKLNDPMFIEKQIKKFEGYLGMRIDGLELVKI